MAEASTGQPTGFRRYLAQTRDVGSALVLSIPLLLLYNIGLLVTDSPVKNGVDFLTVTLHSAFGSTGYLIFQGALLVVAMGAVAVLKHHRRFDPRYLPFLLAESLVYALAMGSLILFVMSEVRAVLPLSAGEGHGIVEAITLSLGAGFYEELVFRLILLTATFQALDRLAGMPRWAAGLVAVAVTSVLFSLAHHFFVGQEPFAFVTFVYRSLAGVYFAALFLARGFAVAAYTHCLYDIYVMVFR